MKNRTDVPPEHQLGDAPIEEVHREAMNALARGIDKVLNGEAKGLQRKMGFCLLMFEFGEGPEGGRVNYISNAKRDDVVTLLKEQLARFEGQPEIKGHA